MAYCEPREARFDLSESTFVSGLPPEKDESARAPAGAPGAFMRAREAALEGDYARMEAELANFIGKKGEYGSNLPIGQLVLTLFQNDGEPDGRKAASMAEPTAPTERAAPAAQTAQTAPAAQTAQTAPAAPTERVAPDALSRTPAEPEVAAPLALGGYERILHLDTGTVEWRGSLGAHSVRWKAFISAPAQVIVIRIESEAPFGVGISVREILPTIASERLGDYFRFAAQALESVHSSGKCGVSVEGLALMHRHAGDASWRTDVLVALETDFPGRPSASNPKEACARRIREAESVGFERLLAEHAAEHRNLFDRVSLDLVGGEPGRAAALFQFGRYLLMSSSRPDSPLPAHLQGVWNDAVACRIGWTCDLHLDINTQMNYWPAEATRLPECALPLYRWIVGRLVPEGMRSARMFYDMPGWAAELSANAYGRASPYWHLNIAPYPTGGAWLAAQMGEHYLYSGDRDFLARTLVPTLRGAVEFFLAYLFERPDGSGLASGPSISPENMFLNGGVRRRASLSPTCEIAVIRETLDTYAEACRELGLRDSLADAAQSALSRLPEIGIGPHGELPEWSHHLPSPDPNHRHVSHLLGLYPFRQIAGTAARDTAAPCGMDDDTSAAARDTGASHHVDDGAYAAAAAESIRQRLTPEELWEDTGWARSALALYAARLGDGEALEGHLRALSENLAFPNLMIRHPPTRGAPSFADVYELDGNTGFTAAVAEGLLRSSRGVIDLLPALPPGWAEGSARGLGATAGLVVDLDWKNGKLLACAFRSSGATTCEIRYGSAKTTLRFPGAGILKLDGNLRRLAME